MKRNYYFREDSIENHENVEVVLNSTGMILVDKKEEPEKTKDEIPEIFIG